MTPLDPPFRRATRDDAAILADLVNLAGEGLPLHFWRQMASPGQDPWEIGRARQAAKAAEGKIFVIDEGDGPVAALTGYAIGADPEPPGADTPPVIRPLAELEMLAPDSWYVNVLACLPSHRGRGLGGRLLDLADRIGRDAGLAGMSVIVADTNTGARRLYERKGYSETARRPCVRDGWETPTNAWVLLTKDLPAGG
jgi:ribosomal protein S18 acetylase RimI-like enzyme